MAFGQRAGTLSAVEWTYADAVQREVNGDAACVDQYFQAAALAWIRCNGAPDLHDATTARERAIYQSALIKLISTGQAFRRLDPRGGLRIRSAHGWRTVPTRYFGFLRPPEEFDRLVPVGNYKTRELNHVYRSPGLGVPTVVIHHRRSSERFRRKRQIFAATAVLRSETNVQPGFADSFVLDMFNPLDVSCVEIAGARMPLASDLSAPLAYALSGQSPDYLDEFLRPGRTTGDEGLFTTEPYQPGKIPIVFVHGLLSSPYTWVNSANEILAASDLRERYQIWGFEYATGEPFLASAAKLRGQLEEIRQWLDPHGLDTALSQTVLVGHSMGGLVSKLQVCYSGDHLWRSVANRSFDAIVMSPATRSELAKSFFFEPSAMVSRVVFIGTPHRGSPWAKRPIGRLGAALVEEPQDVQARHRLLIQNNPGAFTAEVSSRIPTSVDLLEPSSGLLRAIDQLPIPPRVKRHSIIGQSRWMLGAGPSDGTVPVASARHPGSVSEKLVHASHQQIHRNEQGMAELLRILREHAAATEPAFSMEFPGRLSGIAKPATL